MSTALLFTPFNDPQGSELNFPFSLFNFTFPHWLLPSCCSSLAAHSLPISSSSFSSPSFFQCTPLIPLLPLLVEEEGAHSDVSVRIRFVGDASPMTLLDPNEPPLAAVGFSFHFFHRQHAEMRNLFPLASSEPSSSSPLQCRGLGGERVKTSRSRLN